MRGTVGGWLVQGRRGDAWDRRRLVQHAAICLIACAMQRRSECC